MRASIRYSIRVSGSTSSTSLPNTFQIDQRTHAGVLELVAHFAGGVQRIGVDHHQPRAQGAEHRDGILQDIGHLHRDAVAGLEIGLFLQVGGEGGGQTIEFGVAERHAGDC